MYAVLVPLPYPPCVMAGDYTAETRPAYTILSTRHLKFLWGVKEEEMSGV